MRVTLCVSFAGQLEAYDSPPVGAVLDVSTQLGEALCADGRAVRVADAPPELAIGEPGPERAVKPKGQRR